MGDRTKADAYERGMQEGFDLRDNLRERLGDREQDLKILGKQLARLRGENAMLRDVVDRIEDMCHNTLERAASGEVS